MVLSEAGGWLNGDGCPEVVAPGVAVGTGVDVGGGGGGVVTRAGAAGLAVPVRGRGGAVTVTVGIETLGPVCGPACGASGGACGPCEGASDAGGLLVGGGSGDGDCEEATPVKQSNASAELLRRNKRLLRIDMTHPILTGTTRPPPRSTHHGETTPRGCRRGRRWREGVPAPDRCQAVGGARAAKRARWGSAKSNATAVSVGKRPKTSGSGNEGGSASTNVPARWIRVQIAQRSSVRSPPPAGSSGALRASLDPPALATVNLSADVGAKRSRCTCPNVRASWNASANSARYAPNLDLDRNQLIVVALARLTSAADPFPRADAATLVTM